MVLDDARIRARSGARPVSLPLHAPSGASGSAGDRAPPDHAVAVAGDARRNTMSATLGLREGAATERAASSHLGGAPRPANGEAAAMQRASAHLSGSAKVRPRVAARARAPRVLRCTGRRRAESGRAP